MGGDHNSRIKVTWMIVMFKKLNFDMLSPLKVNKNFRKFETFQLRYFGLLKHGILKQYLFL